MKIKVGRIPALLALLFAVTGVASAQYYWADVPGIAAFHPGYDQVTTTSLASGGNVVNQYDIYTATPTTVASGSITQPVQPRSLGVAIVENSGSALNGTITVKGVNQFGNLCEDVLTFAAGTKYAATYNAYAYIRAIDIALSARGSGDVLNVSTYGYGLPGRYVPTNVGAARLIGVTSTVSASGTPTISVTAVGTPTISVTGSVTTAPMTLTSTGVNSLSLAGSGVNSITLTGTGTNTWAAASAGTVTLDTRFGVALITGAMTGKTVVFNYYSTYRRSPPSGSVARSATATGSGGGGW